MKISPVSPGAIPATSLTDGMSAGPTRLARAKAIAEGQDPAQAVANDPQVERAQNSLKRIKLKTQVSPDRHLQLEQETPVATELTTEVAQSDAPASTEPTAVNEETKPLSPQFAALAKERRQLQLDKQELLAKQKELEAQTGSKAGLDEYRNRIKANALSVLMEEGVTYDQLTEQILASNSDSPDLTGIKAEIQAMKEALENQSKSMTERDVQAEKQVLAQIQREADQLIAQGDDYEMIREAGYGPKITELIHRTFKKSGEYMDVSEAANLIEKELLDESLRFAKIKKVQSMLNPAQPQQIQAAPTDRPGVKVMRTLTNRDGVSSVSMSKRERAIAAMEGRLK